MADFNIKVSAETQDAEKKLQRVDKVANEATRDRKINVDIPDLGKTYRNLADIGKNVSNAANDIKEFYKVAKHIPGIGDTIKSYEKAAGATAKATNALANNTKAGEILAHSFEKANNVLGKLVNSTAKLGFALFGLKEIAGVLQAAFGGLFQQTIGREVQLRDTILKTQTTLASTNKVFKNGKEITDPYEKIVSLTGAVRKNIDSIRERSIALAGVTSNDVIEVFGIVAGQISQIGGGLKEAEDLAINFSAALGTFGIPLYQARQEIGSILRGDITMDSYLAKSLGITNEDIAKAKSQTGGVVKFLEDRLAGAVAGQKIAAQGFRGVVSNILDLWELIGQRFGAKLLDPLLNQLTNVFETLFKIRTQIFSIVDIVAGTLSRGFALGGLVTERVAPKKDDGKAGTKALNDVKDAFQDVTVLIENAAQRAVGAVVQIIETIKPSVMIVADAFIRLGKVFIEIKVDVFESLARALANVITAAEPLITVFSSLFNLYSQFLDLPIIAEFARFSATMGLLKRAGMDTITNMIVISRTFGILIPAIGAAGTVFSVFLGGVGALTLALGKLSLSLAGIAAAFAGLPTIASGVAKAMLDVAKNLQETGNNANQAGTKINNVAGGFKNLGETAKLAGLNIIKSLGWIFLIQAGITAVVDAISTYQKANEEAAKTRRAEQALYDLSVTYKNLGDNATFAQKAARDFAQQLADAEYNRATEGLEEVRKKLNQLKYESQFGWQSWGEFLSDMNPIEGALGRRSDSQKAAALLAEQARLRAYQRKYEAAQDKKNIEENIKIEKDKRVNLENEIKDLRRQIESDLFDQRQALAQKEVDIFRAAGELRIYQMEQANKKLLEGEEGASRTALESLNNYLSIRERGELDIESSKKELAIEVINLEKRAQDYRFEIEKKIFDLRKRAGENEVKAAELRARQAGRSGTSIADIADTSLNANTRAWLSVFRAAEGTADPDGYRKMFTGKLFSDLSKHPRQIQRANGLASDAAGAYQFLSTTWDSIGGGSMAPVRQDKGAVALAMRAGVDLATAAFTPENVAKLAPVWASLPTLSGKSAYGNQRAKSFASLQQVFARAGGAGSAAPQLQGRNDIPDSTEAANQYADALRSVGSALERIQALQAALTNAKTKAAFEDIAKALYPQVQLEDYRNTAIELQEELKALGTLSSELYDPEQLRIVVEQRAKELQAVRERVQLEEKAKKVLKPEEFAALQERLNKLQKDHNVSLAEEAKLRKQNLDLTRQQEAISRIMEATRAVGFDLKTTMFNSYAERAQAFSGDDPIAKRLIAAEQKIYEERLRLAQSETPITEEVISKLTEFSRKTREAAFHLGEMDRQTLAYTQSLAMIRDVSKTITESYKGVAQSFLTGGDLKEAAKQMAQSITDKFISIALDSAFKPMEELFTQTLKDVFAGNDPAFALQAENNKFLDLNTQQLIANTQALAQLGISAGMSSTAVGLGDSDYATVEQIFKSDGAGAANEILTDSFNGIGDSLAGLGTVANETNKQAANGTKNLGKFLGAMTGVATGALAITGAIQAMQSSKGGTYETLMGIAGVLGGLGSIFGGISSLGKRAAGGPVNANRPYVVGEVGPELFVPSGNGTILPNNRMGQNPYAASSAYLEQQTVSRSFRSDPIKVDTRVINSVEYVTAGQLQEATRQAEMRGAERGQAMSLASLQNSVRTRKRIGL